MDTTSISSETRKRSCSHWDTAFSSGHEAPLRHDSATGRRTRRVGTRPPPGVVLASCKKQSKTNGASPPVISDVEQRRLRLQGGVVDTAMCSELLADLGSFCGHDLHGGTSVQSPKKNLPKTFAERRRESTSGSAVHLSCAKELSPSSKPCHSSQATNRTLV